MEKLFHDLNVIISLDELCYSLNVSALEVFQDHNIFLLLLFRFHLLFEFRGCDLIVVDESKRRLWNRLHLPCFVSH